MTIKAIPDGYHSATPYLIVKGGAAAIAFYKDAFGAVEMFRMPGPEGRIAHAEIRIGDSVIMLADEHPGTVNRSPSSLGGSSVGIMLYVDDVDATFARAIELGAQAQRALADQFYGDRNGTLQDPFGHVWTVATHIEDVTSEEMERRVAAMESSVSAPATQ
jgi:PhnB protein